MDIFIFYSIQYLSLGDTYRILYNIWKRIILLFKLKKIFKLENTNWG